MHLDNTIRDRALTESALIAASSLKRPSLSPMGITLAAVLIDLFFFTQALWFARYAVTSAAAFSPWWSALLAFACALNAVVLLSVSDSYAPKRLSRLTASMGRAAIALALPLAGLIAAMDNPKPFAVAAFVTLGLSVPVLRLSAAHVMGWANDMRLLDCRAVIAGGGEHARTVIRGLAARPDSQISIHGIFDDRDDERVPPQTLGIPKLGGYDDLIEFARQSEIDMIIISLPIEAKKRIDWLIQAFKVLPVEVRLSTFNRDFAFSRSNKVPLVSALKQDFSPNCRLTKRLFDISISSVALFLCAPIMALAALAVRLESPGPIFFRQKRHGYNDRIIEVLKFRSMYVEATDPTGTKVVRRGDPRVTRVGRILRRSSIDELPQLINVLQGDLSLVGPRPHAIDARSSDSASFARIVDGYSSRHRLPPGITGWAQINGWRGEIDAAEKLHARIRHDLYYIENWSLWFDIKILARTPISLLRGTNAY